MRQRLGKATWAVVVCFVGFAFASSGQSLGELAKKEKKRREENKTEVEVIDETSLASSGGSSADAGPASEPDAPPEEEEEDLASKIFPPVKKAGSSESEAGSAPRSAADRKREEGRRKLEAVFQSMVSPANNLIATARLWVKSCEQASAPASNCDDLVRRIGYLAIDVGNKLDAAHEVARVSLLPPGEVRDLRRAFGMHDTIWDQAVHFAHRFGR